MRSKTRSIEKRLRRQHERGDADATLQLGKCLLTGECGVTVNPDEGVNLLYRLAINPFRPAHDSTAAKYFLGEAYRLGLGVQRDPARSVHWYEESVRCGLLTGAYYIGWWYTTLLPNWSSPAPDMDLASRYFEAGAEEGCGECAAGLAMLHLENLLDRPDHDKGARMLHMAAKGGHSVAIGAMKRAGPEFARAAGASMRPPTPNAAPVRPA